METPVPDLTALTALVARRRSSLGSRRGLLVGLSGIDGSGKGFVAARVEAELRTAGLRVASLNVDGWLNLPAVRFSRVNPGEHFYHNALRLDAMFAELVLPLRRRRTLRVAAMLAEETAEAFHEHLYEFEDVDVVLLEGIFIYKRAYRAHFDVACWVDCTFETALERAVRRSQEGLPPEATISAYRTIYFPAQRLHFERDEPRASVDVVVGNDPRLHGDAPRLQETRPASDAPGNASPRLHGAHSRLVICPPSTWIAMPVRNDARSDARNATTAASSRRSPARPVGTLP